MKNETIKAKVTFGKGVSVDCNPKEVELPTDIDELRILDIKADYGIDSTVIDLFNSALVIRLQANMRTETEKGVIEDYLASKKDKV